jgi:hypothetical protein
LRRASAHPNASAPRFKQSANPVLVYFGLPLRVWLTRVTFFRRSAMGSIPSFAARASSMISRAHAPCGWPGARNGRWGPALMYTLAFSERTFGHA